MNTWVGKHFVKGLFYTPNSRLDPFRQIFRHTGQSAWAPSPRTWPTTVSVSICILPYCSGSAACPPQSPSPVLLGVAANLPSFPSSTTWREVINLAFLSGCCFLNQIRIYPNIAYRAEVVKVGESYTTSTRRLNKNVFVVCPMDLWIYVPVELRVLSYKDETGITPPPQDYLWENVRFSHFSIYQNILFRHCELLEEH